MEQDEAEEVEGVVEVVLLLAQEEEQEAPGMYSVSL